MSLLRIFFGFDIQSDNSFFKSHELEPVHSDPIPLNPEQPMWLLAFLLGVIILLMVIRIFYRKSFSELGSAFFSFRYSGQLVRDENILLQRTTIILSVMFNLTVALFLYQCVTALDLKLPFGLTDFRAFIFFALLISSIYAFKFIILKIAGFIFDITPEMETYVFSVFLINNIFGLLLLPIVIVNFLYPSLLISQFMGLAVLCIAAIFFLYRLIRGVLISRESASRSPVYLFLYLCALEIAPLLVLIKVWIHH
jgi:hypothetical protein